MGAKNSSRKALCYHAESPIQILKREMDHSMESYLSDLERGNLTEKNLDMHSKVFFEYVCSSINDFGRAKGFKLFRSQKDEREASKTQIKEQQKTIDNQKEKIAWLEENAIMHQDERYSQISRLQNQLSESQQTTTQCIQEWNREKGYHQTIIQKQKNEIQQLQTHMQQLNHSQKNPPRRAKRKAQVVFCPEMSIFQPHQPNLILSSLQNEIDSLEMHLEIMEHVEPWHPNSQFVLLVTGLADSRNIGGAQHLRQIHEKCRAANARLIVLVMVTNQKSVDLSLVEKASDLCLVIGHRLFQPHAFTSGSDLAFKMLKNFVREFGQQK